MCPNCEESEETVEHFLGQSPATVLLLGNTFYNHLMTSRDIFRLQEIFPLYHHQVHQTHQLLQQPGQPGPVRGYLMLSVPSCPLALLVSHPLSLQLAAGRSLLDPPLLLPLLLVKRSRQSFFVAILLWVSGVQAPLFKKNPGD